MMKNQEGNKKLVRKKEAKKKKINLMVAMMTIQNPKNQLCVVQTIKS
jgi:hypothetical protein